MALFSVGAVLLAFLVYQIPWVRLRVDWRLQVAQTYITSRLNPAGALPPPQIESSEIPFATANSPTSQPPTAIPQATPTPLPLSVQLTPAEYELQGPNNCGPATLAMYLRYYGWDGDQYDISDEIKPVTRDRNVNVDELIYYTSNWAGWLKSTFRVGGDIDLLKQFLAAGIPVMVEKGYVIEIDYFYQDDYWNGHYALVTGYDDAAQTFTYQDSYKGPDEQIDYAEFDEFWQQFNRVFILLYLPEQEQTVINLLGADWDEEVNRQNALAIAQAETISDPDNAFPWFNLGMNQVYFEDYAAAAASFDRAREIGLPMRMLRYQFGPFFAYYNVGRMDDLNELLDYALQITPESEEAFIWKGWMLYRQGDNNRAISQFLLAQEANPKSVYVAQALSFMGVTP
ncbi:MAG: C39 family peptidase [Chloroflexi bacterium]|nr:C39 family peptidase [Chloroflexota bacterium]